MNSGKLPLFEAYACNLTTRGALADGWGNSALRVVV